MRPAIGQHDIEVKAKAIIRLLAEGEKVKVSVFFKGREITHSELGFSLLTGIGIMLSQVAKLERAPVLSGRSISMILAPR